jgi:hypothetical protein
VSGIISAFSSLVTASWKAFIGIIMAIIIGTIISAFVGASFDIVQSSVQDNPAASGAVEAGQTVYDVGSTVQDIYEYGKILLPVGGAIVGVSVAVVALLKKLNILD